MLQELIKAPLHQENDTRFEYMIITSFPGEPKHVARAALREHADNGKWELVRTCRYEGGAYKYWLRRRVMRVKSTLEIVDV
ncbi:hypothetical protein AUR04nite_02890 [Glutamicibacter uratoxydans]|uniref:Uncharacterized protein n=1 Tax=Glutamicibacter uratoxydans TaxID=43667 RepID=A0A4Y4DJF6_GLUUR|nr:DUF5703 family protein [Glutamicibacter uratoxydans]GED04757.1 hypothetical protein AUR04nite_02890 [Glutamicibacter uratoxydans]